jgi:RimJ/RimL family protein N-acetyltransferase
MLLQADTHWRDDRVELFLLEPAHVGPAYVGWLNDPAVNRYLESRFVAHTQDSVRAFVASQRDSQATLFLGIRSLVLDGRHVGNIKLGPIDGHHRTSEVGILIGEPRAWGRGIGSAAIERLAAIGRQQLNLRRLTAGCYASNRGSIGAFLKAGFLLEGRRPGHFLLEGRPEDVVLMGRQLAPA